MQMSFVPYSISSFRHHQTEIKTPDIQEDTVPSGLTNQASLTIIHQYIARIIKLYYRELKSHTPIQVYECHIGYLHYPPPDCRFNINLGIHETTKMEAK